MMTILPSMREIRVRFGQEFPASGSHGPQRRNGRRCITDLGEGSGDFLPNAFQRSNNVVWNLEIIINVQSTAVFKSSNDALYDVALWLWKLHAHAKAEGGKAANATGKRLSLNTPLLRPRHFCFPLVALLFHGYPLSARLIPKVRNRHFTPNVALGQDTRGETHVVQDFS